MPTLLGSLPIDLPRLTPRPAYARGQATPPWAVLPALARAEGGGPDAAPGGADRAGAAVA